MGMWSKLLFWIGTAANIWLVAFAFYREDWFLVGWLSFLTIALCVIFADDRKELSNERTDRERNT